MLRSVNDLEGYAIEASDGKVGKVIEFYFDDEKWTVRYLVADTGGWLTGRKVLISPSALGDIDWDSRQLHVDMPKKRVENSPDIDTDKPVSRQHERAYYDYYSYPYYWAALTYGDPLGIRDIRQPIPPPAQTQCKKKSTPR